MEFDSVLLVDIIPTDKTCVIKHELVHSSPVPRGADLNGI